MAESAEFVTGHFIISSLCETRSHIRDVSWNDHGIGIRALHEKSMRHVSARQTNTNRRRSRHDGTMRNKRILLRYDPHRYGAIGLACRTEIAFDEFAFEMQRRCIDGLHIARR